MKESTTLHVAETASDQAVAKPDNPQVSEEAISPNAGIAFSFNPFPVLIDYALRWVLLGLLNFNLLPEWIFWLTQIVLVPFVVGLSMQFHIDRVNLRYGTPAGKSVAHAGGAWPEALFWSVLLSGCYITFDLVNGRIEKTWIDSIVSAVAVIGTLVAYGIYVRVIYDYSVKAKAVRQAQREEVVVETPLGEQEEEDVIDKNDVEIIEMQSEIVSISQRVDTYTLESALFGALAFSGFLTLISSEKPVLRNIQPFLGDCVEVISLLLSFAIGEARVLLAARMNEGAMIAAVTLETLVCSMLFVSVIISRIRLSDVLRRADYAVRVASTYNVKEEEIHNLKLQDVGGRAVDKRLEALAKKISIAVASAQPLFGELWSIAGYMRVFRNLGIASFVLILITSAFWASTGLGLAFAAVFLLAYTYTTVDEFFRRRRLNAIQFFQKQGKLLFRRLHE